MGDLTGWQIAATTGALAIGATLQTSSGFGFALLALPLLGWIGVPGPLVITMSLAAMMLQGVWLLSGSREPIRLRENAVNAAATMAASVAGVALLSLISGAHLQLLGQLIGALLLRPTPREKVGAAWTALADGPLRCALQAIQHRRPTSSPVGRWPTIGVGTASVPPPGCCCSPGLRCC